MAIRLARAYTGWRPSSITIFTAGMTTSGRHSELAVASAAGVPEGTPKHNQHPPERCCSGGA
jgi:hypothetical protein